MSGESILLETIELKKYFKSKKRIGQQPEIVKSVDGVSLAVKDGKTLGVVGESGCGKSTLGRTILRLCNATEGDVLYRGESLIGLSGKQMRVMRQKLQIIFQDPYASLNPRMTVKETIRSSLDAFKIGTIKEREKKVLQVMERVGLGAHLLDRYPHEFSGGQRQRIVIARALILNPGFIVCDEPVSALDVSVRSQVLNLMRELQNEYHLTYLFISHDLSVVRHISDEVAVMYLGRLVEVANKSDLFETPCHPYTKALMSAIPVPDVDYKAERIILQGDVPNPLNTPTGCAFHPRCPYASERCIRARPEMTQVKPNHNVACHLYAK